jgi:hypothetical protein
VIAIARAVQEQQATVLQIASSTSQTTSGVRDLKQAVDVIRKSAEANKERAERLVASAKGAFLKAPGPAFRLVLAVWEEKPVKHPTNTRVSYKRQ